MRLLPQFKSDIVPLQLMQSKWAPILNSVLELPSSSPSFLSNIAVTTGNNVINHRLGRNPVGYLVIDADAAVSIYRSAPFNDLTLTLNSSGNATISLMVF